MAGLACFGPEPLAFDAEDWAASDGVPDWTVFAAPLFFVAALTDAAGLTDEALTEEGAL